MLKCPQGCLSPTTGPVQIAGLDQVRFVNILQGSSIFLKSGGKRFDSHRPTVKFVDDREENLSIHLVETGFIDSHPGQPVLRHLLGDMSVRFDLRVIPDPFDQPIGDARRSSTA